MIRLGVLGSTKGTDLLPVLNAIEDGRLNAAVEVVVSNKKNSLILDKARVHNIDCFFIV